MVAAAHVVYYRIQDGQHRVLDEQQRRQTMKAARTRAIAGLLLMAGTTTALPVAAAPAAPAPLHVSVAVSGVISTGASYVAGTVTVSSMRGASCSGAVRIGLRTMASTTLPMKVAKGTIYWRFSIQSA